MKLSSIVLAVACSLLLSGSVWAQSATSGAIAGAVKDATGAVLPGVTVEASSPALIEKVRTVVTDDQGAYKIVNLRPGTYAITFTLGGFGTVKREGLELTTGFTATVNIDMRVGSLTETITVTGASPVVDTQNVRSQTVYSHDVLDALPTSKAVSGFAALTPGVVVSGSLQDVGGNRSDQFGFMRVHGGRDGDGIQTYDGMRMNDTQGSGGGQSRHMAVDQVSVQETTLETAGMTAESEKGGVQVNYVPKDGSNTFKVYGSGTGVGSGLQNTNINDALRARGVTDTNEIKKVYDVGAGVGGPISHDKLWFYTSHRWWGSQEYIPRQYYNLTPHTFFFTPDLSRRAYTDYYNQNHSLRLTWQATTRHKLTFTYFRQADCQCNFYLEAGLVTPEAAPDYLYKPASVAQATWSHPRTNRLLFEAGVMRMGVTQQTLPQDDVLPTDISILELTTNVQRGSYANGLGSAAYGTDIDLSQNNGRFSVSYVTGSHAFKTGLFAMQGVNNSPNLYINQSLQYQFRSGLPSAITEWASPSANFNSLDINLGLFAQDQWTLKKLTLNVGVRFDQVKGSVPAQQRPAGLFVGALDVAHQSNLPNLKDVSPRLGAAYDLFGNGKTAFKASIGRFVVAAATDIATASNPANAMVTSTVRTWADADGNFVPDCNLQNPGANGECGAINNSRFGTVNVVTHYADEVLHGWGNRGYTWQGSAVVQQELRPGTGLSIGYYRTWFGNFTVTQNTAVTASDFTQYCVAAPVDSRLPGGGGNQVCGLYDVSLAKFGQVNNLIGLASTFGDQSEVFNGVDVLISSRFREGGLIQGGVSTGRTVTDNCYQNTRPDLSTQGYAAGTPRVDDFCHVAPSFNQLTQVKVSTVYPLPWAVQASVTYQNIGGLSDTATYVATNSQIAPSLGRNLSSGVNGTATVSLIPANTLLEDRLSQLDLRFTKIMKVKSARIQGRFDIYNVFNAGSILGVTGRYGPTWLQPTQILGGRVFKFGGQVDF